MNTVSSASTAPSTVQFGRRDHGDSPPAHNPVPDSTTRPRRFEPEVADTVRNLWDDTFVQMERGEPAVEHQPSPPIQLPVGPSRPGQQGQLNFFYQNPETGDVQHSVDIVALLNRAVAGRLHRTPQSHEASAERNQAPRNGEVVLNQQGTGYISAFYELA